MESFVTGNCRVIRKGIAVEVKYAGEDLDKTSGAISKGLANVGIFRSKYWVYDPAANEPSENQEQLWLVLRNYIDNEGIEGIRLQQGDIMKMGRCKYLIKELISDHHSAPGLINLDMPTMMHKFSPRDEHGDLFMDNMAEEGSPEEKVQPPLPPQSSKEDETRCRICLGDEATEENPLISSPCKCMGTVRLIHANCLQQWLKSKVTERKSECVTAYTWKQFECDVCKVKYPSIFKIIIF